MGNAAIVTKHPISCFKLKEAISLFLMSNPKIKLILCEGGTRVLKGRMKIKAGEIMFEFPDSVVCHADSFFLGRPIPVLGIHDKLVAGHSYFILPLDRLPSSGGGVLSAASLCSLASPCPTSRERRKSPVVNWLASDASSNGNSNSNGSPLRYVKGKDGKVVMIKVDPDFLTKIITNGTSPSNNNSNNNSNNRNNNSNNNNLICSTPELQKQYQQLVRAKDQGWSPKLETITEHNKVKFSPSRLVGLAWKHKEKELV